MRKALVIASMASMLDNFNRSNISILDNMGYDITLAASFGSEDSNSGERNRSFHNEMISCGYSVKDIGFSRSLGNILGQLRSIFQVNKLLKEGFDLVHCHSPICSVITRLLYSKYRKKGGKIIYTAHGFHFYKGAPLKNWLIYFPVEWLCSFFTDVLITINKEDYHFAKRHMHAKKVVYVPGVGVDTTKFKRQGIDTAEKRRTIDITDDDIMLLSVGELSDRKNHQIVIKALGYMKERGYDIHNIKYVICGIGDNKDMLENMAEEYGADVRLLGYRSDIAELCECADIYVFPSLQEGLPVALMEAMSMGLPCIASKIRGNTDLIRDGVNGYLCRPNDTKGFAIKIRKLCFNKEIRSKFSTTNLEKIQDYNTVKINYMMKRIYETV